MSRQLKVTIMALLALGVCGLLGVSGNSLAEPAEATTTTATDNTTQSDDVKLVEQAVYVFAKNDGSVRKVMTSDWVKNSLGVDEYNLMSAQQHSPIAARVKYYLNGEEKTAQQLVGSDGEVKIRYEYENKELRNVRVGNAQERMYAPYMVLTGMVLDNTKFTDVNVKNGKVINDGNRTVVLGVAMPGMQENLQLGRDIVEIPRDFELTATAKDFALGTTMAVATDELLADFDVNGLNSVDDVSAQIDQLNAAMNQLIDGATQLYDGLAQLQEKTAMLPSGVAQLNSGALQLKNGARQLDAGVGELQGGVTTLQDGLNQIVGENNANSAALVNGASSVYDVLLMKMAHDWVQDKLVELGIDYALPELTKENYPTLLAQAKERARQYGQIGTEAANVIEQYKVALDSYGQFYDGLRAYTDGVNQVTAGVNQQLAPGVAELKAGTSQLADGAAQLSDGIATLNVGVPAMVDGINQLKEGSDQLRKGLVQFDEEGIEKIVNAAGSIEKLTERLRAMATMSQDSTAIRYIYRFDEVK